MIPREVFDREFGTVHGWYNFESLYQWMVDHHGSGSQFVEVGSWLGRSTISLARMIQESEKQIKLYAVDTFAGSPGEPEIEQVVKESGGSVYHQFYGNLKRCGVDLVAWPLIMSSLTAAWLFDDASLDFVFIDASHMYEDVKADIEAWLPKIKTGGWIGGHDYSTHVGVSKAVDEKFPNWRLNMHWELLRVATEGGCWLKRC
jgi:predicted O-methyltransferase YrrM